jgi:predicted SprT family Zn-dependent metalloprotease
MDLPTKNPKVRIIDIKRTHKKNSKPKVQSYWNTIIDSVANEIVNYLCDGCGDSITRYWSIEHTQNGTKYYCSKCAERRTRRV